MQILFGLQHIKSTSNKRSQSAVRYPHPPLPNNGIQQLATIADAEKLISASRTVLQYITNQVKCPSETHQNKSL